MQRPCHEMHGIFQSSQKDWRLKIRKKRLRLKYSGWAKSSFKDYCPRHRTVRRRAVSESKRSWPLRRTTASSHAILGRNRSALLSIYWTLRKTLSSSIRTMVLQCWRRLPGPARSENGASWTSVRSLLTPEWWIENDNTGSGKTNPRLVS